MARLKILVIRFSSLGDVVLTTAVFPNLKKKWPEAEVSVLTRDIFAEVFDNNPYVDHVYVFNPKNQEFKDLINEVKMAQYDVIVDLQGNIRSWMLRFYAGPEKAVVVDKKTLARRLLVWTKIKLPSLKRSVLDRLLDCLAPLDVEISSRETQLFPKNEEAILKTLSVDANKKLLGLAPGAKHKTKQWLPERFAESANRLGQMDNTLVVILGGKEDQAVAEEVSRKLKVPFKNLCGWTSIKELTAVMSKLNLLITNDSALLHMGEALKIPLVTVFGPTVRAFGFAPYRTSSRVVEVSTLKCRPCSLHGDERCPLRHHNCMKDVDVDPVLLAASSLLEAQ